MKDEHTEELNAQNYNPNRPQGTTNPNSDQETKKVVDTAAKGAAEYLAPGVGGKVYEVAKKVPGAGEVIDNTADKVAKTANKVPGVKEVAKGLNDSGITSAVNKGIDLTGDTTEELTKGDSKGLNKARPNKSKLGGVSPVLRKNTMINEAIRSEDRTALEEEESSEENIEEEKSEVPTLDGGEEIPEETSDKKEDKRQSEGKVSGLFESFIKQYKWPLIIIGGGFALIVFIFFLILTGGSQELYKGENYYDTVCNYNETQVTITNCYQNVTDREVYDTVSIEEFVKGATYAYTKGEKYSDEVVKALMIILKTNALSYGNYNASSKNVEIKSCDVNINYCNLDTGCYIDTEGYYQGIDTYMPAEEDKVNLAKSEKAYVTKLDSLYSDISNYLYVSTSYRSTISFLNSSNVLEFSQERLNEMEEYASNGDDYEAILKNLYGSEEEQENNEEDNVVYKETLYLGDSRTQGIINAGLINASNTVYGVGYGYNWLVGNGSFSNSYTNSTVGGIKGINGLMRENASYNIVIWLGVNDYSYNNANTYFNKYQELATGEWSSHNLYIVALGPVDDSKSQNAKNEGIDNFNNTMRDLINSSGLSNLKFIDLGYTQESINTYDEAGLHYGRADYEQIYNIITNNIDNSISGVLGLYNLSTYCTYYTLTDNEAYWWPIGSMSATEGNIYGGAPVTVVITSYFGPRIHPVTGKYQKAHGALDIGASRDTPVIATKDGTVSYTHTGCSEGNQTCGGSYGNHIIIDHDEEIQSLYAHLKTILVKEGDQVKQGQIIAYSGSTGRVTGPHLHFEIRLNGTRVDPLGYVDPENPRPTSSINFAGVSDSAGGKQVVCESLLASGLSKNAVVGILINMAHEGSFRTNNLENCYEENQCCKVYGKDYGFCVHPEIKGFGSDELYTKGVDSGSYAKDKFVNDRAGYGLIQWTSAGRKQGLYEYAKSQKKSIADLSVQLGYLLEETKGYAITYKYITGNYSASDVALNFCLDFESPAHESTTCPNRVNESLEEYINYVNNNCGEGAN